MSHEVVTIVAVLTVFGFPTGIVTLFLRQRHVEKMKKLDTQASAQQLAALEAARTDLEARVRTLETIATGGDHDLEERFRKLLAAERAEGQRLLGGKKP